MVEIIRIESFLINIGNIIKNIEQLRLIAILLFASPNKTGSVYIFAILSPA